MFRNERPIHKRICPSLISLTVTFSKMRIVDQSLMKIVIAIEIVGLNVDGRVL